MRCPRCGADNEKGRASCLACYADLSKPPEAYAKVPRPEPPAPPAPPALSKPTLVRRQGPPPPPVPVPQPWECLHCRARNEASHDYCTKCGKSKFSLLPGEHPQSPAAFLELGPPQPGTVAATQPASPPPPAALFTRAACPRCGRMEPLDPPGKAGDWYTCTNCSMNFYLTGPVAPLPPPSLAQARRGPGTFGWVMIALGGLYLLGMLGRHSDERGPYVEGRTRTVTATTLYDEYRANEVAADEKYRDTVVCVTGIVDGIGKDILDTPYITLQADDHIWGVQCMFGEDQQAQLARLTRGQMVTVRGKCEGFLVNVLLRGCRLVG